MNELQEDLQLIALQEKFFSNDKEIYDIIHRTNGISKTKFIDSLQKGDIALVYPKLNLISTYRKINYIGNSSVQGVSFSSSKIYAGDGKMLGFGINFREGPSVLSTISTDKFLNNYQGILILRHVDMTDEKANKIIEYMKEKMNKRVKYSHKDCFISIFKHIFKETDKKLSKSRINQIKDELFCSNIINLAFIYAGLNTGIKDVNAMYVWPIDFLKSKKFKPVFRYFTKGELE